MSSIHALGPRKIFIDTKLSSGIVKSHITVSKSLEKYFRCLDFFSCYDAEIVANDSILNIPVLSIVLPLAWITGAEIYVDELDEIFTKSMNTLQLEYKKIYPKAPFKTKLFVNNIIKSKNISNNTALLFSGGLDSTYSLFSNNTINPRLIMIFGVMDIPILNVEFQEQIKTEYSNFVEREGLKLNFIHTNALEVMDHTRLRHLWGKFQGRHEGDFWNGIGYSLGQIGQVAPLSIGRFNRLLFAASYDETHSIRENPDASSPDTDEKIAWANLNVKHDGNILRHEKVFALRKLLINKRIKLRVCLSEPEYLLPYNIMNCSKCEKCLRTIAYLAHAGIDPNYCGFNVDNSIFNLMRYLFEEKLLTQKHIKVWWEPLQQIIPEKVEIDLYGSKDFFEWFKTIDLDLLGKPYLPPLFFIYFILPYFISNNLKKVYEHIRPTKHRIWQPIELRESTARAVKVTED